MQFESLLTARFELGECPVWSGDQQALYWVDIPALRAYRLDWASRQFRTWPMPTEPGSLAPAADGTLVLALRDGFHTLDMASGALATIAGPDHDLAVFRFNDGRCDANGRFWAGTMDTTRSSPAAGFWCLDRGALRRGPQGVTLSNGLAFSPDGRWMYHADSVARVVYRYPFDLASGHAGERTIWFTCPAGLGDPDGASVDEQGFYWIAMYGGGCLLRIRPDGSLERKIDLPVRCPTMVAFAGPHRRSMVVTTSRRNRSAVELEACPLSGALLFTHDCGVQGMPEIPYRP